MVNVTAESRSTVVAPVATRATMRPTRLAVLPVPAAASTRIVVWRSSRIAARAAASGRDSACGSVGLFGMELSESHQNFIRARGQLRLRPRARFLHPPADRL